MNLTEIYIDIFLENFFKELQEEYLLNEEANPALQKLLEEADTLIFERFAINKENKVYFIAGSAALYLFPALRDTLELKSTIGDLDIVIPESEYWENLSANEKAGKFKVKNKKLFKSNLEKGIYRPEGVKDGKIEAFTEWNPAKAGGEYGSVVVRSTSDILNDAFQSQGYWFMSLRDIFEYKIKLARPIKDAEIIKQITAYQDGTFKDKISLLRNLLKYYKKESLKNLKSLEIDK